MRTGNPLYGTIQDMRDGHAKGDAPTTLRPPAHLKRHAQTILKEAGWDLRAYFVACLAALVTDPEAALGFVSPHRPEEKRRGRPPRTDRE